nr:immunoglobulin heavy chain junction region [Macaca mulatta]MOW98767.1 immunoglobulin heavy chain junction region [Macaca mulatta]MOX00604.1 immunoglobulin heavy chain junction region [Macaca mulatta]MOX00995.1 immunoglobulin heavy chain junction region [Macaca mulatta]MOX01487.1 immunoglobulin heavy chain junction region [Macaca mulatta]
CAKIVSFRGYYYNSSYHYYFDSW